MRSFVKYVAKNYFNDHRLDFGDDARYLDFLIVEGTPFVECSYPADVYGYMMYVQGGRTRRSHRYRVQYCWRPADADLRKKLWISSWCSNEYLFHRSIWPLCVDDSSRDLVQTLHAYHMRLCPKQRLDVSMFECQDEIVHSSYSWRLNSDHLEMMARRIGQFHGRLLETRARKGSLLPEKTQWLRDITSSMDATLVIPMLEHCYGELAADWSFMQLPDSAPGMQRLKVLIDTLNHRLHEDLVVNPDCLVLCHGSYSQAAVFFRYKNEKLVHAEIGYWGKVRRSSLADDLVILMFVDAGPWWSLEKRVGLVEHYIEGLKCGCPNEWVPTSQDIWREIGHRIPLALYAMATRVDQLRRQALTSTDWNDKFVVDMLKVLISTNLV